MKKYESEYFHPQFSHIYLEKRAEDYELTRRILSHFKEANVIFIDHYKDIFNRSRQDIKAQIKSRKLILAVKEGQRIYEGAPLCQDFGNKYFYYSSCMMNCIFDCEYCYLKGMYPSGNIVIFVNSDDYFKDIDALLKEHPVYLCVSYDTDLAAAEEFTGYIDLWRDYSLMHPDLTIEIRTKSAGKSIWGNNNRRLYSDPSGYGSDNMIYAFTISPQSVIDKYEHKAPSLKKRLECAAEGIDKGFRVRLCFDPVVHIRDWRSEYRNMIELTSSMLDMTKVCDYSVGSFRIPRDYLKSMRKQMPSSSAAWYPYSLREGVYRYDESLENDMIYTVTDLIREKAPDAYIAVDI